MINVDIDFDADGKQQAYIRFPHSSNISAYGWIGIPICVVKNGEGPTIILSAGNHGDEYEGMLTLRRLAEEINHLDVQGRIIILPSLNLPAVLSATRCSPIDNGNLNRSFTGNELGTITEKIAHYLEYVLMPLSDIFFDIHSGGKSLTYDNLALVVKSDDPGLYRRKLDALRALGLKFGLVAEGAHVPNTSLGAADRQGILGVSAEFGGSGKTNPELLTLCRDSVDRLLKWSGVKDSAVSKPAAMQIVESGDQDGDILFSHTHGWFEPYHSLGDSVKSGEKAGVIHFLDDTHRSSQPVYFENDGVILAVRPIVEVENGDCLFHVGRILRSNN